MARAEHLKDIGVTGKAFSILEYVAACAGTAAIPDIIRSTGISKPSAYRIVKMLCGLGFLQRDPTGYGFESGGRLIELSNRTILTAAPQRLRHAILEELSQQVGETCNFGVLAGTTVTYLDRVETKWPLGLRFNAGSQVPAHCTAIGKLLLSKLPKNHLKALTESVHFPRYTSKTLTNPMHLRRVLAKIRKTNIGIDNQEFMDGVVCVAVPVQMPDDRCLGGIAISAPEARMTLKSALSYVSKMRDAANRFGKTYTSKC